MTHSELVSKAADAIEDKGLARYERKNDSGAMCALGALDFVLSGDPEAFNIDAHPVVKRIVRSLGLTPKHDYAPEWALADWSNESKSGEVVKAFRRLASLWKR